MDQVEYPAAVFPPLLPLLSSRNSWKGALLRDRATRETPGPVLAGPNRVPGYDRQLPVCHAVLLLPRDGGRCGNRLVRFCLAATATWQAQHPSRLRPAGIDV